MLASARTDGSGAQESDEGVHADSSECEREDLVLAIHMQIQDAETASRGEKARGYSDDSSDSLEVTDSVRGTDSGAG